MAVAETHHDLRALLLARDPGTGRVHTAGIRGGGGEVPGCGPGTGGNWGASHREDPGGHAARASAVCPAVPQSRPAIDRPDPEYSSASRWPAEARAAGCGRQALGASLAAHAIRCLPGAF